MIDCYAIAFHPQFRMASIAEVWNAMSVGDVAEALGVLEALVEQKREVR